MKSLLIIFIKAFIYSLLPFLVLSLIFEMPEITAPLELLLESAYFAIGFAAFITLFQFLAIKSSAGKEWKSTNYGVRQTTTAHGFIIPDALADTLAREFDIHRSQMNVTEKSISFRTDLSASSIGEVINIDLESDTDGKKTYHISSRPRVKLVIMDFGKNYRNVKRIREAIPTTHKKSQ